MTVPPSVILPPACRAMAGGLLLLAAACLAGGLPSVWAHQAEPHGKAAEADAASVVQDPDYDYEPPAAGSYRLPPIKQAGNGIVLDETGRARGLRSVTDGRITLLAFIYTRCADPKGCPLSLSLLYELHDLSRDQADLNENLQFITLSLDPGFDTPAVMAEHAAGIDEPDKAAPWHFLTTASQNALRPILRAYDQPIGLKTNPDDPLGPYTHQLRVFLIDRAGQIRDIYSLGFLDPRLVLNDVRTLLLEEKGQGPAG